MHLRVVIADDEPLARERLRQLLQKEPRTEIVAECGCGTEVVEAVRKKSPNVVFLDIKMPELDGFGVVEALNGGRLPAIVFITAYDQFAARAFEVHAVDYLVKPFDRERFQTALRRARQRLQGEAATLTPSSLTHLLADLSSRTRLLEHVTIKSGHRIKVLKVSDIDWISSADNYVELHAEDATHLMRITISALADRLAKDRFARISRSVIVNLDRVKEMRPKSHGDYQIVLHNGATLAGTRHFRGNLMPWLSHSH